MMPKFSVLVIIAMLGSLLPRAGVVQTLKVEVSTGAGSAPDLRALVEATILQRKNDAMLPRYTYFMLDHTQNRSANRKLFLDSTILYEYTWIKDLPYGRIVESNGKLLKAKHSPRSRIDTTRQ